MISLSIPQQLALLAKPHLRALGLSFSIFLENWIFLRAKIRKFSAMKTSQISDSFVVGYVAEGNMMTEEIPKEHVEQAETDAKTTVNYGRPTTLSTMLTSLMIPARSLESIMLLPMHSQMTATVASIANGESLTSPESLSAIEKARQIGREPQDTRSDIVVASEPRDTEKSPMTETELSEPATGTTIASYRTEASSPVNSSPEEHIVLSWRQKMLLLGIDGEKASPWYSHRRIKEKLDPVPTIAPRVQEIMDANELTVFGSKRPPIDPASIEETHQSPPRLPNKAPASDLSKTFRSVLDLTNATVAGAALEFHPQTWRGMDTGRLTKAEPSTTPLPRTGSTPAYNPLAAEWCPSEKRSVTSKFSVYLPCLTLTNATDTLEGVQARFARPQLTVTVPNTSSASAVEHRENARMLEWVQRTHPLQLSKGEIVHLRLEPVQKLTSAATTTTTISTSPTNAAQELGPNKIFNTRRFTITAPLDTTQLHTRPTLAQRRAERQLAQSQLVVSQSAPNTATLQPASLHTAFGSGKPTTESPSPSATASLPGQLHQVSHTQSLTWKRPANPGLDPESVHPEFARWIRVEQDLLRMGLIKRVPGKPDSGSFVVPKTFEQWLEFRAGRTEDALEENAARIRKRHFEIESARKMRKLHGYDNVQSDISQSHRPGRCVKIEPAMGGKHYRDNRGTVLANLSIWSPWYQPTEERPEALWPCLEEMKEEGDERHTSSFGRFPPLPRVPGNPTVVWKVKPMIPALHFDEVWKLPNKDSWSELYNQKPRDAEEGHMEELIGQSLLEAINS